MRYKRKAIHDKRERSAQVSPPTAERSSLLVDRCRQFNTNRRFTSSVRLFVERPFCPVAQNFKVAAPAVLFGSRISANEAAAPTASHGSPQRPAQLLATGPANISLTPVSSRDRVRLKPVQRPPPAGIVKQVQVPATAERIIDKHRRLCRCLLSALQDRPQQHAL